MVRARREYECGALRYGFSRIAPTSLPNSAGRPSRFGQGMVAASAAWTSSEAPAIMGVSKTPGATAQTRTPSDARSRAIGSVMPTTAPLDAE